MPVLLSEFAANVQVEIAFTVLAAAKQLQAAGKEVIELEIGDSPFPTTAAAKRAGIAAIETDRSHYCPSPGLPEFRAAAAESLAREYGLPTKAEHIVAGHGAKIFELLFCEAFLNPGDGVLVFSPHFPTYLPNIARRGARAWLSDLKQERDFRPNLDDVERFLRQDPRPKAIFLNSPHNPTGGVATREDLVGLADLIRGKDVVVFSDEPYNHMIWRGQHHTLLSQPGMFEQCVAAYTFSKSYSMSGWRLGFAASCPRFVTAVASLINTTLSCVPPLAQLAGIAAMREDTAERDQTMQLFRRKVEILVAGLNQIPGVKCLDPGGTFYVFPRVAEICNAHGITSHGLALYLLEGADDRTGVACLGGECFGAAGGGFLRFSCAEPDDRLRQALDFVRTAFTRKERIAAYLASHAEHRLAAPYATG